MAACPLLILPQDPVHLGMGRRAKKPAVRDNADYLVAVAICMARCESYVEKMRAVNQEELAQVYEGFLMLLDEFSDDLRAGERGQVLVDLS